jgi:hypothetical protein
MICPAHGNFSSDECPNCASPRRNPSGQERKPAKVETTSVRSSMDRASDFGSDGWEFESLRARKVCAGQRSQRGSIEPGEVLTENILRNLSFSKIQKTRDTELFIASQRCYYSASRKTCENENTARSTPICQHKEKTLPKWEVDAKFG